MEQETIFNYIIAKEHKYGERLSTYTYGSEIFRGNLESANEMLDYVKGQRPTDDWFIYKIITLNII